MQELDPNLDAVQQIPRMKEAIENGDLQTVLGLLREGFDLDCSLFKPEEKYTALHFAVVRGKSEISCVLLAAGASINAKTESGATPLHLAAFHGWVDVLTVVLAAGADINAIDDRGGGPLHWWASGPSNTETVELLIKAGCNPNAHNYKGKVPLHDTIQNVVTSAALIRGGAKTSFVPENAPTDYETPFQAAVHTGRTIVVQAFVEYCGEALDQKTLDGRSLMDLAMERGDMRWLLNSLLTERAVRDVVDDSQMDRVAPAMHRSAGISPL